MKKGLFFIIAAGLMWGNCCIFVNILDSFGFSRAQMVFLRIFLSAVIMFLYCLIFRRKAIKVKATDLFLFFICGLSLLGTGYFYYEAMYLTSASTAVVLMYVSPVPIMLFSVLFFGERLTPIKVIGVFLMLIGCAFVAGIMGNFKPNTLGVIMGLLSAASFTAYNIFNKLEARHNINSFNSTLYTFIFAALCGLFLCNPLQIPSLIAKMPIVTIPTILGQSIVTCFLPYLLYSLSLKNLSVGVASAMSIIEPMTGALLGIIFFKDTLTIYSVLGMILVIGAVFLLGVCEIKNEKTTVN